MFQHFLTFIEKKYNSFQLNLLFTASLFRRQQLRGCENRCNTYGHFHIGREVQKNKKTTLKSYVVQRWLIGRKNLFVHTSLVCGRCVVDAAC